MARNHIKLSTLSVHPKNEEHRKITDEAMEGLRRSIVEGSKHHPENPDDQLRLDMSVTVNRNGKRILGGHQRIKVLEAEGQDWVHKDDVTWVEYEPDSAEELACVVRLNSDQIAGEFTDGLGDVLRELNVSLPDMSTAFRFDALAKSNGIDLFGSMEVTAPDEFPTLDEDIATEYECPQCGYQWSGKAKQNVAAEDAEEEEPEEVEA